ncbi:unnamed protein product [Schistocephalus solidus]|uniref:Putative SWI/SNF-related matrix-associated actin-dependent regulator of chromatin subfamily A member 3-like 1 n=1 Tax=Schistocephalus solidus TaxID=70667 RepID=A0A0X3NRP5_SCHSO|nr:unnamed protein product [Schistocephalus solidus]
MGSTDVTGTKETLQISAEKFGEITECVVCLEPYKNPHALPCQHYLCLTPCAEDILQKEQPECPLCRSPFTRADLKPFLFYRQLQEYIRRAPDRGFCGECGRWVEDAKKDLRPAALFKGLICAECVATEALIKSMESQPQDDQKEEKKELCLELVCPGPPACSKVHIGAMVAP